MRCFLWILLRSTLIGSNDIFYYILCIRLFKVYSFFHILQHGEINLWWIWSKSIYRINWGVLNILFFLIYNFMLILFIPLVYLNICAIRIIYLIIYIWSHILLVLYFWHIKFLNFWNILFKLLLIFYIFINIIFRINWYFIIVVLRL